MALKRTLLSVLIIIALFYLCYQLWLVLAPLKNVSIEEKYVSLINEYQLLKVQRLVLEEKSALQQARAKFANRTGRQVNLANLNLSNSPYQARRLSTNLGGRTSQTEPVTLSLQETKTFEQLEAYVSDNKPPTPQPLTRDEKFLLEVPYENFTLQLMGVRDVAELTRFVGDNPIENAHIFHTYYLNKDWYVLVLGSYKNHTEALKAIDTLPTAIKNLKPWIRQFSSVQKAIQLYR